MQIELRNAAKTNKVSSRTKPIDLNSSKIFKQMNSQAGKFVNI